MKLFIPAMVALGLAVPASAKPAASPHYAGQEMAGRAHVTLARARAIALRARPGRITDFELEKEAGGSGLRYSFDITAKGKATEVGVDAMTGKVLENKLEGKNPD